MKRTKNCNGYVIYEAKTSRDEETYNCHIGNFNIYIAQDIRDFGLTNSYPEYEDIDSLAEAIAICSGSKFAVAVALADELSCSTAQDMDLCLEIERRLESGEAINTIRRCYDPETGRLYESISEAIADGFDPYANDEFDPYEDHPADEVIRIPHSHWEPAPDVDPMSYDAGAEAVIADYLARSKGLTFDCHGDSAGGAYYMPGVDKVVVPDINLFDGLAEYYSTTFHELGHSTGHSSRLNRFTGKDACAAFGSESYSREELVAEITAASILSELGLEEGNSFRNSAAYVKSWAKHIKEDPMMFVTAASRAEKAIDLILGRTPAATTC